MLGNSSIKSVVVGAEYVHRWSGKIKKLNALFTIPQVSRFFHNTVFFSLEKEGQLRQNWLKVTNISRENRHFIKRVNKIYLIMINK